MEYTRVYNELGQLVAALINTDMQAGRHMLAVDAAELPSGLYVYAIQASNFSDRKKMRLLK